MVERVTRAGNATIGLAAVCAAWFKEVGLQGEGKGLAGTLQRDYQAMVEFLRRCFGAVVAPGVITTTEEAERAASDFEVASVDAVLLVHIMWNEDQPLISVLENRGGRPLILWHYRPAGAFPPYLKTDDLFRYSGTVGALQGSAVLQRLGIEPVMVAGMPGEAELAAELRQLDRALSIRHDFLGLRAGRIAGMCDAMTGTAVSPEALRARLGVQLVEISAQEYAAACQSVSQGRVRAFAHDAKAKFAVEGVCDASLELASRNTLALDDLVARHGLGVVAIQDLDPDLHRLAGVRPCLCPPISAELGVAFGMESDLHATLGLLACMKAAGAPAMYTEVFTFDPRANTLLMGHAGVHDPRLAAASGVTIVPDYEYRHADIVEGAWQEFILREGPVTCASLYDAGDRYRLTVFEGESLGGERRLQGFAHALVCPDVDVKELLPRLLRRGMTQHFAVAPGRLSGLLAKWCRLSGIEFCSEQ